MEKYIYLINTNKSYLTVVNIDRRLKGKDYRIYLVCLCECGNERLIEPSKFLNSKSKTMSCGCINKSINVANPTARKRSVEYRAHQDMKARCYRKTRADYNRYGGRGITVCDRWLESYDNFIADMGLKPDKSLSLDRIDNNGNYEPSNCRWATKEQQNENRRKRPKGLKYKPR